MGHGELRIENGSWEEDKPGAGHAADDGAIGSHEETVGPYCAKPFRRSSSSC
jgi:hypothetical protein